MSTNPNYPYNYKGTHNFIDDAIQNGPNEFFHFNDDSKRLMFFNDLYKPLRWPYNSIPGTFEDVGNVPSRINNEGFRSDDFAPNVDLLLSGCSQTYGMGLPEKYIFADIIKRTLGITINNLGAPGASWTMIVDNIFAYFKKYGHPKKLVVVFPNTERLRTPINKNILITEYWTERDREKEISTWECLGSEYLQVTYLSQFPGPRYSKRPHIAKDVFPHDFTYYTAIQSLNRLEQYCEMAEIPFKWTTWDFNTGRSIEKMRAVDPSYFKGYFDLKMDHWCHPSIIQIPDNYHPHRLDATDPCVEEKPCPNVVQCHLELKEENELCFHIAYDSGHWGSHRHAHIADTIIEQIK